MSEYDKDDSARKESKEIDIHINSSVPHYDSDKLVQGLPTGTNRLDSNESNNLLLSPGPKDSRKFKGSSWRWLMLFLACNYLLGSYFCYDNPGVIQS